MIVSKISGCVSAAFFLIISFISMDISYAQDSHGAQPSTSNLQHFSGSYVTNEGKVITLLIAETENFSMKLFTDYSLGYRGLLEESEGAKYDLRDTGMNPIGRDPSITFIFDKPAPEITFILDGDTVYTAQKAPTVAEEVTFQSGENLLAGTLIRPETDQPVPAIVFIHGSGAATRHDYFEWGHYFAANGIATLVYDKQGAGQSEGNWQEARFKDLASDAAAAVGYLKSRPEIDPGKIGVSGGSQGAWIAPLVLGLIPGDVAYMIITAGGPTTPKEQERFRRLELVKNISSDEDIITLSGQVLDCYLEFVGSGGEVCGEKLSAYWKTYGQHEWYLTLDGPRNDPLTAPWPEGRKRLGRELNFDPRPLYENIEVPVMGILGLNEQTFPVDLTVSRYQQLVAGERLNLVLIENADHGFFIEATNQLPRHQSPRLFREMLEWIKKQNDVQ